jgi:chemotaxis protein MotB
MLAKQHEVDACKQEMARELARANAAAQAQHDQDEKKYNDEVAENQKLQQQLNDLQGQLGSAQTDVQASRDQIQRLLQAKNEYETRLRQLDDMRRRFNDLRQRLASLTAKGLTVVTRNNRMVIQLKGDVLFDSGLDTLKPAGKSVLKEVADVIKNDSTLSVRVFQVAGHTDNVEYGTGPFGDNWGLSLARAKSVLLFMISPDTPPRFHPPQPAGTPWGGGLDPHHWSAAGYGIWDPIAGSVDHQSPDDQQKNRRVELVLEPSVDELLSLSTLADDGSGTTGGPPQTTGAPATQTTTTATPAASTAPPAASSAPAPH